MAVESLHTLYDAVASQVVLVISSPPTNCSFCTALTNEALQITLMPVWPDTLPCGEKIVG